MLFLQLTSSLCWIIYFHFILSYVLVIYINGLIVLMQGQTFKSLVLSFCITLNHPTPINTLIENATYAVRLYNTPSCTQCFFWPEYDVINSGTWCWRPLHHRAAREHLLHWNTPAYTGIIPQPGTLINIQSQL